MAPKKGAKAEAAKVEEKKEVEEPAAKKAKTEDKPSETEVKPGAAEATPKKEETEKDAPDDKRPKLKEPIVFNAANTTLNTVVTMNGKVLMPLSDGGAQFLIAGARANVGMKAGIYYYELKVVETLNLEEGSSSNIKGQGKGKLPYPKQLMRMGFSTADSSLILGDGDENGFSFCGDGFCTVGSGPRKKKAQMHAFQLKRDVVLGLLLNLDSKSPNKNTVSLFRNGERASEPMELPESFVGKTLYPHVSFRNLTLQMNFGPVLMKPLPFKCRGLGDAASSDVVVTKPDVPADGKHEVVFPIGFPDQGTFDWLDGFVAKNPQYTEISDRAIIEWAVKSGMTKGFRTGGGCNDRPMYDFGINAMDDGSARHVLTSMASVVPRNYIIMDVKRNLTPSDRKEALSKFPSTKFKRTARVAMGEPKAEFKKLVQDKLIKEKGAKVEVDWKARLAEKSRLKDAKKKAKELEIKRKHVIEEAKKRAMAAAKAKLAAQKKKDAGEEGDAKEEEKEEEPPKEEEAEEKVEEADPESEEEAQPEVVLTEEEQKAWFMKRPIPDLLPQVLEKCFGGFAIPDKAEGFDEVKYEWQNSEKSNEFLRNYILEKKRSSKVEDLVPGEWFKSQQAEWSKKVHEWQIKQKEAKANTPAKKPAEFEEEEGDESRVDITVVEDILDIGGGEPLFLQFGPEDWELLKIRWELHTMAIAFTKDVNDKDRPNIPEAHLGFYFNKYHRKSLAPKVFSKDTVSDLVNMVKDVAQLKDDVLSTLLDEEVKLEEFVKMTETVRRGRQRRIDAGDETARMTFVPSLIQTASRAKN